jgi:hypothetical protein
MTKRTRTISTKVTPDEEELIKKRAAEASLTVSDYSRAQLLPDPWIVRFMNLWIATTWHALQGTLREETFKAAVAQIKPAKAEGKVS